MARESSDRIDPASSTGNDWPAPARGDSSLKAAASTSLGRRFPQHLARTGLIPPGSRVLVALSGGLDSVVLLHLIRFLPLPGRYTLAAAHFDHAMRPDSAADAAWVAGLCRAWEVPLDVARADSPPRSEDEAREARYAFLARAAERAGADLILTAHHADDQAETVLFRAARGTGLRGLAGIPDRRGRIVRPLLPFHRAELAAYAAAAGLRYRVDPTNETLSYARNRLRHEVIPRLEAVAPGASRSLARLADLARDNETAWDWVLDRLEEEVVLSRAPDLIELARPILLSYHPAIRARLLHRLFRRFGSSPGRAGTMAALEFTSLGASGGRVRVGRDVHLERELDRVRIRRGPQPERPANDRPVTLATPEAGAGEAVLGGRRYSVEWTTSSRPSTGATEDFDPSAIAFPLCLRAWQPGDRIRLPFGTKKLKKLFLERRLTRSDRARVPVLADASGRILWVVGIARADLARPSGRGPVLHVAVRDAGPERS